MKYNHFVLTFFPSQDISMATAALETRLSTPPPIHNLNTRKKPNKLREGKEVGVVLRVRW